MLSPVSFVATDYCHTPNKIYKFLNQVNAVYQILNAGATASRLVTFLIALGFNINFMFEMSKMEFKKWRTHFTSLKKKSKGCVMRLFVLQSRA